MKIVMVTTCKNRAFHLAETLPRNLADNPSATFVVLDYDSQDNLQEILRPLACDRLKVYRHKNGAAFHMAHAKNMAHRCAIREGANILVTLDADNFTGPHFDRFVMQSMGEPGVFLIPDHQSILKMPWDDWANRPNRGFAGRLVVRAQDFIKAGGYNEIFDTWRGEDIDFNARMGRMGYEPRFIDTRYLQTIPHSGDIRFKEWPEARQYEVQGSWKVPGQETATVVNYGRIGVGTVFVNGNPEPIELKPMPTRIFGVGMQKTATTSLHKAFQILGFDSLHWGKGEAPLIWDEVNSAGRSITLEHFYAICDNPIPLLYQKLDAAYPGSKFILTVRDEQKWLKSVEKLWDANYNPTRWTWDVWPITNRLHKALYGRTDFDAEAMLTAYRRHNLAVVKYFADRPNDLLVMNMEVPRSWESLCTFLDRPVPSVQYPREYVTRVVEHSFGSGI